MIDFFIQVVKNLNISDAFSSKNCFADFFATIYSLLIHNRKTPSFRSRYYVLCLFNNRGVPYMQDVQVKILSDFRTLFGT